MRNSSRTSPLSQMPPISTDTRNVLIALFGLFICELMARRFGAPVDALIWFPYDAGFSPYQLFTRFFVMGGGSGAVTRVLFGLLVVFFFLDQVR